MEQESLFYIIIWLFHLNAVSLQCPYGIFRLDDINIVFAICSGNIESLGNSKCQNREQIGECSLVAWAFLSVLTGFPSTAMFGKNCLRIMLVNRRTNSDTRQENYSLT